MGCVHKVFACILNCVYLLLVEKRGNKFMRTLYVLHAKIGGVCYKLWLFVTAANALAFYNAKPIAISIKMWQLLEICLEN